MTNKLAMLSDLAWEMQNSVGKNTIYRHDGFSISYAPVTSQGSETAIIDGDNYYILVGDHREPMKGKSLAECLEYFSLNQHQKSPWSDNLEGNS